MSIVFCIEDFDIENKEEIINFKECINKINTIRNKIDEEVFLDIQLKKKININELKNILDNYHINFLLIKEITFSIFTSNNFEVTIIDRALERNIDKILKFNLKIPYEKILKNLKIFFNIKGFVEFEEYNNGNKIIFFTLNQLNRNYYDKKIKNIESLQKFINSDNFIFNRKNEVGIKKKKNNLIDKNNLKINFRLFIHRYLKIYYINNKILLIKENKFKLYFNKNFLKNINNQLYFDEKKANNIYNQFGYKLIILFVLVFIYRKLLPFKVAKLLWNLIKILKNFLTSKKFETFDSSINESTLSKLSALGNFKIKSFIFSYIYIIKIIIQKLYLSTINKFSSKKKFNEI